jgi:adenosine deaminase
MIDIFSMKHASENAVQCQMMKVGISSENPEQFEIAFIAEYGNVLERVKLFSAKARELMIQALAAEIEYAERDMMLIAQGEEQQKTETMENPTNEVPF